MSWVLRCVVLVALACVGCRGTKQSGETQQQPAAQQAEGTSSPGGSLQERIARERWSGDLDGIVKRRMLRVLVTPGKLAFFFNGTQMQGAAYEAVRELELFLNKKLNTGNLAINVVFIPVGRDRLIPMLAEGKGDLVATLMGASDQRSKLVDFSDPIYDKAKGIIVSGPGASPISKLEDLSGKEVYYFKNTLPFEKLGQLSESFKKAGKPPIRLTPADENLVDDDVLEMVNAGLVPMTIAEDKLAQYWIKVLPNLQLHRDVVVAEGPLVWAIQRNTPQLKAVLNEFVQTHRIGTAFGNTIVRKYLRDIKWAKNATGRTDLARFQQLVGYFKEYGDKYDLPYLLLAAQGYQESGLNPTLRSRAGAVGVMQIKPNIAASIGFPNVHAPDRNIEAGTKYLRLMVSQYYANEPMDRVMRGLFALASYNAGPTRIQKLRKQAAAEGYDQNRWFNNVEIIASREVGREPVQYVSNIYKYYLAYTMVTDREAQRQAARQKVPPSSPE